MGFLAFIFKFFLFLILIGLISVGITAYRGIRLFRKMTGQNTQNRGRRQQRSSTTYSSTRTSDGVTIEDRRSPSEVNKKIFAPDEGEYVDFKEE